MSAHSVSPPRSGTTRADSSDAFADTGMYELSVCHPWFPRTICITGWSGAITSPAWSIVEMGTAS